MEVSYTQSVSADRYLYITELGFPTAVIRYRPLLGAIPDTWNFIGLWYVVSVVGEFVAVETSGQIHANFWNRIDTNFLFQDVSDGTFQSKSIFVRLRPFIPDGAIGFEPITTPATESSIRWRTWLK